MAYIAVVKTGVPGRRRHSALMTPSLATILSAAFATILMGAAPRDICR
jgi:hypothetical protein